MPAPPDFPRDLITWRYDVCPLTPNGGTTQSFKPRGVYKVGDRSGQYPHMLAIDVRPWPH